MKQLTSKQCRFLILFYVALNKIMLLPSLICSNLTNNFWLLLIVMFGLEFLFILMILSLNKQFPDLTLKQRMQMVFGKIFTKIFYFLIGLLLLFKLVLIIHECYIFLYDSLYSNYKWIELIIPLAIFMIYVGAKSFTNFGRCIQIIRAIIYGCIAIALFDATSNLNLLNMLPVFTTTVNRTLHTCFNYSIWFGDFILLLFAVGSLEFL